MINNNKNIIDLIKRLEKDFGQGVLMSLDSEEKTDIETFSTGSILLNNALGTGGYPKGRIIEIFGPESSGKTTFALLAIAEIQKLGGRAAFIDVEHSIDPNYAKKLGVNTKQLIISQPDSGEKAMEIVYQLIDSKEINLIVVDSAAALVPEVELEGTAFDQTIGAQARLISKALRRINGPLSKNNVTIIFINQIREKVGVVFGNPEITPGGRALKFYSSIRMDIRLSERLKEKDEIVGQKVKIKIIKNKLSSPFKVVEVDLFYGKGVNKEAEIIDLAVEKGIIEKSGSWFSYNKTKLGQGKNEASTKLREDNKLKKEILDKLNK